MRARLFVALVVLSASPAFAPAPFPRPRRGGQEAVTLGRFQGTWKAERFETVTATGRTTHGGWENTQVRVEGDRWTFFENGQRNAAYRITIAGDRTAAIEFFKPGDRGELYMNGLIRRREGKIEILYNNANNSLRAVSFENPPVGWWVLTLRPDR